VNIRSTDETLLREKKWQFKPHDDAESFQKFVNLMNSLGRMLKDVFRRIDIDNTGVIDKEALEMILQHYELDGHNEEESLISAALMISECDLDMSGKTHISFADFFALMSTSDIQLLPTSSTDVHVREVLAMWIGMCNERLNSMFLFRDDPNSEKGVDDNKERQTSDATGFGIDGSNFESFFGSIRLSLDENGNLPAIDEESDLGDDDDYDDEEDTKKFKMKKNRAFSTFEPRAKSLYSTEESFILDPSVGMRAAKRLERMSIRRNRTRDVRSATTGTMPSKPVNNSLFDTSHDNETDNKTKSVFHTTKAEVYGGLVDKIAGEILLTTVHKVVYTTGWPMIRKSGFVASRGCISLTNYRILFYETASRIEVSNSFSHNSPKAPKIITIPLSTISHIECESTTTLYDLVIISKDLRVVRVAFPKNDNNTFPSFFRDVLGSFAFPPHLKDTFAFKVHNMVPDIDVSALLENPSLLDDSTKKTNDSSGQEEKEMAILSHLVFDTSEEVEKLLIEEVERREKEAIQKVKPEGDAHITTYNLIRVRPVL
jgi:hypothetical protein